MQLYYLSYIKTIIDRKNLTKAAEELNMTQTALSKAVARLEDELGYPLFERSGRNIIPTAYGSKFYDWANQTLAGYDQLIKEFHSIHKSNSETLTIAFDGMYSSRALLMQAHQQSPQLKINEVYYNSSDEFPDIIYKSHIDCVLSFTYYEGTYNVNRLKLLEDPLLLILPASSQYAARSTLTIEEIKDLSFVFPSENDKIFHQVQQAFSASGFELKTASRIFRSHLLYVLTEGLACGFISHHTLSALGNTGKYVCIPMKSSGFDRNIYLYWLNKAKASSAFQTFLNSIKNNLSL